MMRIVELLGNIVAKGPLNSFEYKILAKQNEFELKKKRQIAKQAAKNREQKQKKFWAMKRSIKPNRIKF
jgi:hypothetical protein